MVPALTPLILTPYPIVDCRVVAYIWLARARSHRLSTLETGRTSCQPLLASLFKTQTYLRGDDFHSCRPVLAQFETIMQLGDLPILAARKVAEPPAKIPMDRVLGLRLSTGSGDRYPEPNRTSRDSKIPSSGPMSVGSHLI
jgi:hypothetical protein